MSAADVKQIWPLQCPRNIACLAAAQKRPRLQPTCFVQATQLVNTLNMLRRRAPSDWTAMAPTAMTYPEARVPPREPLYRPQGPHGSSKSSSEGVRRQSSQVGLADADVVSDWCWCLWMMPLSGVSTLGAGGRTSLTCEHAYSST